MLKLKKLGLKESERVMNAMLKMDKIHVKGLEQAYEQR